MEQFANKVSTVLNGAINNVVTSIPVVSTAGFPSIGTFRIKIDDELMLVTAVPGAFTVTRGAEGTVAASHLNSAAVTLILTAGAITQLKADTLAAVPPTTNATVDPAAAIALSKLDATGTVGHVVTKVGGALVLAALPSAAPTFADRLTALDANHIHAWELTETSGTTWADTGNSAALVPLTIVGIADQGMSLGETGPLGPCAFNGANLGAYGTSVNLSTTAGQPGSDFPTGANPYTLEYWFSNAAFTWEGVYCVVCDHSNAGSLSWSFNPTSVAGEWSTYTTNGPFGTITSKRPSPWFAVWQHVMVTFDGSLYKMYVNGILIFSPGTGYSAPGWATAGSANRYFGVFGTTASTGNPLHGWISRVRMSNIARSQAYARAVYKKAMLF